MRAQTQWMLKFRRCPTPSLLIHQSHNPRNPPPSIRRLPPHLGEHTREALGEFGFLPEEIDALDAS